jgi:hypothetical protein
METPRVGDPPGRYLVELTQSKSGFDDIQALAARSRTACDELSREGTPVRFLRSVFVPEDGSCFLLLEAPSAQDAGLAVRRAELGVTGIAAAHRLDHRPKQGG